MRRFLIIFIFIISFVSLSFSDLIKMNNGTYIFKSLSNEKVTFIVETKSLKLVTEDGSTFKLTLLVNENGDHFYFSRNKEDDYIIVRFDNTCVVTIETSNDRFFLFNSTCKET